MSDEKPNQMRMSYKLIVGASGLVLTLSQAREIKELITGDQKEAIAKIEATLIANHNEMKALLATHSADETAKRQRLFDILSSDIATSESRCEKRASELKSDISTLQVYAFKTRGRFSSQN